MRRPFEINTDGVTPARRRIAKSRTSIRHGRSGDGNNLACPGARHMVNIDHLGKVNGSQFDHCDFSNQAAEVYCSMISAFINGSFSFDQLLGFGSASALLRDLAATKAPRWNQNPTALLLLKQWRNIMISKFLAISLLATIWMTGAASAQTASNQADSTTSTIAHKEGEWRASKLAGINVYNEANEKIGDINEVIVDRSGRVANVILAVGGVLGLGEHYVAVAFDKLTWVDQPVTSTTASTTSAPKVAAATPAPDGNTARTTTGAATTTTTTTTTSPSKHWYPDHAVYNATKDELKAMPEFKY
jgi:sporulation protein YlmC with PRC-barrel domain